MDDPAGVVGFCQRVRPRLVGTLGLLCGDRDVGEELAQETLARVWLRWGRVRELDEGPGGYQMFKSKEDGCVRAVFRPNG